MKAKNFRVGNYLQDNKGRICKVEKLGTDWNENGIEAPAIKGALTTNPNAPIELTYDWLINFGFVKVGSNYEKGWLLLHTNKNTGTIDFLLNEPQTGKYKATVLEHVHQLQNLFFAITGTEIKLKDESSACV